MQTRGCLKLLLASILFVLAGQASAVVLYSSPETARASNPIPAGATATPGSTLGGGIDSNSIMIDVGPSGGTLKISVDDCCLIGDVYEVILDAISLGLTSIVPIGGATLSSGMFLADVGPGAHSVDVWDVTLSYLGEASPFGGGTVPTGFSPAGLSVLIEFEAKVPEPSIFVLLGLSLTLIVGLSRGRGRLRLNLF